MAWIKRNLFFVIGAAIALICLVGAGFYTWTGYQHNEEKVIKLNESYTELKTLTENPLLGGAGGKVDNIKAAAEQQKQINDFLGKARKRFATIAPIPESPQVTRDEYASVLRLTIDQLQREATNNSVVLPPRYSFSFEAQRQRPQFAAGSLPLLATQLGEVKAICEVLNKAKINAIESIRRERVSTDDDTGPAGDYLAIHSQTNELAILAPYEVTFRSFSPELAAVLSGFANSPHGMIIKAINVEAAAATGPDPSQMSAPPTQYQPVYQQPIAPPINRGLAEEAAMADRYGTGRAIPRPVAQPVYANPVAPVGPRGIPVLLNEKQLKVTLLVYVVKLLPKK